MLVGLKLYEDSLKFYEGFGLRTFSSTMFWLLVLLAGNFCYQAPRANRVALFSPCTAIVFPSDPIWFALTGFAV
jgi:hypothetical protein